MVVHGFRNASDADVKYLNLHAPGCGFIDYMRGPARWRPIDFDQADPEGVEGLLPSSETSVGEPEVPIEGERRANRLLCDVEALSVSEIDAERAAPAPSRTCTPTTSSRSSCWRARWAS